MDAVRVGRSLRAIRVQLRSRQIDVADRARVSRSFVSKVELGLIRTSDLDRLLDEAHAILVDRFVRELRAMRWEVAVEVTFNHFGDRGSIDIFGWHAATRSVLIVEVKSVVPDSQATLMPLDRKFRLGLQIARERGFEGATVSRLSSSLTER